MAPVQPTRAPAKLLSPARFWGPQLPVPFTSFFSKGDVPRQGAPVPPLAPTAAALSLGMVAVVTVLAGNRVQPVPSLSLPSAVPSPCLSLPCPLPLPISSLSPPGDWQPGPFPSANLRMPQEDASPSPACFPGAQNRLRSKDRLFPNVRGNC